MFARNFCKAEQRKNIQGRREYPDPSPIGQLISFGEVIENRTEWMNFS